MQPPRTLSSLPSDVLLEILGHLLLDDAAPTPHRAAILQTCRLFYDIGLPLLYRVIDLGYYRTETVVARWEALFGQGGLFAEGGTRKELGEFVRELRLGGGETKWCSNFSDGRKVNIAPLHLPACSSLLLDNTYLSAHPHDFPELPDIISQLPVVNLFVRSQPTTFPQSLFAFDYSFHFTRLFGPSKQPARWTGLQTVVLGASVLFEHVLKQHTQLSLLGWSFKVLVVEADHFESFHDDLAAREAARALPVPREQQNPKLEQSRMRYTERVEFRLQGEVAGRFEHVLREEVASREKLGLNSFEKRIASLIAFIGENGKETRLMEVSEE